MCCVLVSFRREQAHQRSPSNSSTLSLSSMGRAVAMFIGDGGRIDARELGLLGKSGGGVGVL